MNKTNQFNIINQMSKSNFIPNHMNVNQNIGNNYKYYQNQMNITNQNNLYNQLLNNNNQIN